MRVAPKYPNCGFPSEAMLRDVVLTVTLKIAGVVALMFKVVGGPQLLPLGAPVHVSEAVPPIPPPPIERAYDAELPAFTIAVLEPPCDTVKPRLGFTPWPDKDTVWGESAALSEIDSTPVRLPKAVGENVTEIWHVFESTEVSNAAPQLLVSEKSPVVPMLEILRLAPPAFVKVIC